MPVNFIGDPAIITTKVDWKLIDEAVAVARQSDVVIIFGGLNHDFDTESSDKQNMDLPYGQEILMQEVAKANPNNRGSAYDRRS